MSSFALSIVFIVPLIVGVFGQQLTFTKCSNYVPINVANYSLDYSSKNPLGYNSSILPYMDVMVTHPCVNLTNVPAGAYIEIKAETQMAGAKICVGDDKTKRTCSSGTLRTCYSAPATNVKFAFYCDSACEQVDVVFWYRFVMSEANPSDQWCEGRISDDFPSSLIPLPSNLPTTAIRIKPGGNAIQSRPASLLVHLSIIFVMSSIILL